MTDRQREGFERLLGELGVAELIHGDCVGADAEAHGMAACAGVRVRIRPSNREAQRAYCVGGELIADPEEPLARNRRIVDDGELLIATPGMMKAQRRSGVWATIRYASRRGRPIHVIWPDGQVERR